MTEEKRKIVPDDCTSSECRSLGCDYCRRCSHAIFRGSHHNGKTIIRWEFSPWFGFEFRGGNFRPARPPGARNPVWEQVANWMKERGLE